MPARPRTPIEIVCAAAAVVVYVRCPLTKRVFPRPEGNRWAAWFKAYAN